MASAVSINLFSTDHFAEQAACEAPKNADCSEQSGQQTTPEQSGRTPADSSMNKQVGHFDLVNPKAERPLTAGKLLASLNDVYFKNNGVSSEEPAGPTGTSLEKRAAPTSREGTCLPCVAWELNQLPKDGDFMASIVARLEHLKACGEEVSSQPFSSAALLQIHICSFRRTESCVVCRRHCGLCTRVHRCHKAVRRLFLFRL